jgi:hypothetical protein
MIYTSSPALPDSSRFNISPDERFCLTEPPRAHPFTFLLWTFPTMPWMSPVRIRENTSMSFTTGITEPPYWSETLTMDPILQGSTH